MSNFRLTDRQTGFLMPPLVEVVDSLDLRAMSGVYRGSGSASYHPSVLLSLLVYGYARGGVFQPQAGACDV